MLIAEMKVNGTLVGVLYIHNTGWVEGQRSADLYNYEVVYHRVGSTEAPQVGAFKHSRADGADVCVEKALKSLHGN